MQTDINTANTYTAKNAPVYGFPNARASVMLVKRARVTKGGAMLADDHLSKSLILDNCES